MREKPWGRGCQKVALARLPLFLLDIEQALCNFNIIFKSISRTAVVSDIAVVVVVVVKGPVIINRPVGGGGGGAEDFRGNHLIFGRTKGGISRN